jgi:predicted metalloprotease
MEEEKKEEIEKRPFFMTYEKDKWVLNVIDPKTKEIIEKKVSLNGKWKRIEDK